MQTLGPIDRSPWRAATRAVDRALDSSPVHEDRLDAEIERLAGEFEEREGPGALARLLADVEAEVRRGRRARGNGTGPWA